MSDRREYEMTEADLAKILDACKPVCRRRPAGSKRTSRP